MNRRRWLLAAGTTVAVAGGAAYLALRPQAAPIGFSVDPDELANARALLARHPAFDAHAHPGRSFVDGAENLTGLVWVYAKLGSFERDTIADMRAGGLAAAAFAAVSDFQVLGLRGQGLETARPFEPGEAFASYRRQMARLRSLAEQGLVAPLLAPSDLAPARAAGKVGAMWTVEGGDFLEGRVDRVAQAHADGVRSITLLHYRGNELGDIITDPPVHGRLTDAGAAVVREMNRLGMLIDVAHASEKTARGIVDASAAPVMASHVHVHTPDLTHPRFVSLELVRAVAAAGSGLARAVAARGGGVIGAWPAGIGITDLAGYVRRTLELVDMVGIDHVCLGTDMDANYKPVFDTYTHLPHFVAGLVQHGMAEADIAKLIGGNFLRVWSAAHAARTA